MECFCFVYLRCWLRYPSFAPDSHSLTLLAPAFLRACVLPTYFEYAPPSSWVKNREPRLHGVYVRCGNSSHVCRRHWHVPIPYLPRTCQVLSMHVVDAKEREWTLSAAGLLSSFTIGVAAVLI